MSPRPPLLIHWFTFIGVIVGSFLLQGGIHW